MTTQQLCAYFPTSRYAIMGHLTVLAEVGLVLVERRGRERLNHLNPVPLQLAYDRWLKPLSASAAAMLTGLRAAAESAGGIMDLGIDIRAEHVVRRDATATWDALMRLAAWWPRCWPESENLVFEAHVGGRLGTLEAPDTSFDVQGGGTLWGVVEEFYPARTLTVRGAMGLCGPVSGYWRMDLVPEDDATRVTLQHQVAGLVSDEDRDCFATGWIRTLRALASAAEAKR
ncbi:hypothetical protein AA2016_5000 [Aminobacter aminovorans]|nr:hypothetical protein AA2016_5000 [Aminobacter aminovorans]